MPDRNMNEPAYEDSPHAQPQSWNNQLDRVLRLITGNQRKGIMPPADVTGATLVLVVAAMCYLACLALGAMVTVTRTSAT